MPALLSWTASSLLGSLGGMIFRSIALAATLALGACQAAPAPSPRPESTAPSTAVVVPADFSGLEARFDARLGVYALDTGFGRTVEQRADERVACCSRVNGLECESASWRAAHLDLRLIYTNPEIVDNTPVTEQHVADGMTIQELMDAAIRYSDNAAANLLFTELGGPPGLLRDLRAL